MESVTGCNSQDLVSRRHGGTDDKKDAVVASGVLDKMAARRVVQPVWMQAKSYPAMIAG